MNIVHIALTSVVGSAIKIVNSINRYTDHRARLVNFNVYSPPGMSFQEDLVLGRSPIDEIRSVVDDADIIHLHQVVDLTNNQLGIDFTKQKKNGRRKPIVRQFASEPGHFEKVGLPGIENFLNEEGVEYLVNAQYHERFYPQAIPVPLLTDVEGLSAIGRSAKAYDHGLEVSFSPSNDFLVSERRWASKGSKETFQILEELDRTKVLKFRIEEKTSNFSDYIRRKASRNVIIDEVVSGSFHTSGLEGLALGRATIANLDARTMAMLVKLTGSIEIPFINSNVHTLNPILRDLSQNLPLVSRIGERSRSWMNQFYHEKDLVRHYVRVYENIASGKLESRADSVDELVREFLSTKVYDLQHRETHGY